MKDPLIYVIKDREGNYISPHQVKKGWFYLTYTGRTTGFTFYSNKYTAENGLKALNDLGNDFSLECINLESVPMGKRIENIACRSVNAQAV